MIHVLGILLTAMHVLIAAPAPAQRASETPFGEGWKRVVPIPMPQLGEGDRYVAWVDGGWLQVRREGSDGVTDWHIVLARAEGAEPQDIAATPGTTRFALSFRGGRYFVREDNDLLSCLREPKPPEDSSWPAIKFLTDRYVDGGSASDA